MVQANLAYRVKVLSTSVLVHCCLTACVAQPQHSDVATDAERRDSSMQHFDAVTHDLVEATEDAARDAEPSFTDQLSTADGSGIADSDAQYALQEHRECPAGSTLCDESCVSVDHSVLHCGACDHRCPTSDHGAPRCAVGVCALDCDLGFLLVGQQCIDANLAPRLITPMSLSDVTSRRPTFRVDLGAVFDSASLELCADRLCSRIIETVTTVQNVGRPRNELPPGSVVFWRARGRIGRNESGGVSATWLFHVPIESAAGGVDTSANPHADYNGDGDDDLIVGSYLETNTIGDGDAGIVRIYLSSPNGLVVRRQLEGASEGAHFGWSIANAGDVNGDGFGDLIVGAPASSGAVAGRARAYVFYGPGGRPFLMPTELRGVAEQIDRFGSTVAMAGDVDQDGFADVIVGAPNTQVGPLNAAGTVRLYRGAAEGVSPMAQWSIDGTSENERLGSALAGGGDINGDGFSDVMVGTGVALAADGQSAGKLLAFHGQPGGLAMMAASTRVGSDGEHFAAAVAFAGDINGDGYSDAVIGAPYAWSSVDAATRVRTGAAYVFHGAAIGIAAQPEGAVFGDQAEDRFGGSVNGASDVDGDGFDDIVVGAPYADPGGRSNAGTATVFRGTRHGIDAHFNVRVLEGTAPNEQFGMPVVGLGDVNGDTLGDIVVGAAQASPRGAVFAGQIHIFHGSRGAGTSVIPAHVIDGVHENDRFGAALAWLFRRQTQRGLRWL